MKMKKLLSLALVATMAMSTLAACGGKTESTSNDVAPVESVSDETGAETADSNPFEEHVTLRWYLDGNSVTNDSAVMEAINKYLNEKINADLEIIWGTWGDFDDNSLLAINSGDPVDIYFTCSWTKAEYNTYAKKGAWLRLDDPDNNILKEYGSDVWNILPQVLKDGAVTDGNDGKGVYAIPGYKDFGTQNTWDVNVTLLKELGYTLEDIESRDFFTFGDILAAAKAAKGDNFYPLVIEGAVLERMVTNSIIVNGDSTGALSYYLDPSDVSKDIGSKVVNKFATEEYKKFAEKVHEYYELGYIDPALANGATANDTLVAQQNSAQYLIGTQSYALGYEYTTSAARGIEVAYVPCTSPYVDKTAAQGAMMAISATSENPERAMAFLNLLNTDPYLMQLVAYGVEGIHYQVADNGLLIREEKDADGNVVTNYHEEYTPWRNGLGNITLLTPTVDEGEGFFTDKFIPYYTSARAIPAFGYSFDGTGLDTELAAVTSVQSTYALPLDCGAADVDEVLPKMLAELEAAGIDKIVAAANEQLDAYFASK
jgi:putative aldouronate transport system substrate-binding protein